ncbi:hypothetical protein [Desertibacillus haloalkaliphilus]|uniref:hypothetical protein n=1 Tax=Desertibacillus haloalkaliphilus TaxID=1328930 RepID=UPI001C26370C|nr:hypothetical protein [Desertibacillus haloalkaliphilus]
MKIRERVLFMKMEMNYFYDKSYVYLDEETVLEVRTLTVERLTKNEESSNRNMDIKMSNTKEYSSSYLSPNVWEEVKNKKHIQCTARINLTTFNSLIKDNTNLFEIDEVEELDLFKNKQNHII